tara:strand:+ start:453 stop:701 length:249 start_codon:yes stop_codon:yes gene_type:complete
METFLIGGPHHGEAITATPELDLFVKMNERGQKFEYLRRWWVTPDGQRHALLVRAGLSDDELSGLIDMEDGRIIARPQASRA